ncbi:ELM2 and Myb SANT-like domain containing 1 [Cichlidogyrus casuarinus]|uniref:ELM2 and Myb SANT-like domain containing 1 n=1 Tax=Cichlidogyrus casuarinus TaxID=1844966 RepID=A0ABD2QLP5_9PLAT
MINIGSNHQAEIPECRVDRTMLTKDYPTSWEELLWYPEIIDDKNPQILESLQLLMRISCSVAVRYSGINMEYAFHLLCKHKGNLEETMQVLLRDCFVVYDYIYAETTVWTRDEIKRFQLALHQRGRDFHQVSIDLRADGMNKSVKACVEFYYVWKRMNSSTEVNRFRSAHSGNSSSARTSGNNNCKTAELGENDDSILEHDLNKNNLNPKPQPIEFQQSSCLDCGKVS